MLTQLHIKNFTIIDEIHLDLKSGMTVLTGETGAGKSIIIDALELVVGARAGAQIIRQGADRCDVSAVFDAEHIPHATQWLEQNDFPLDESIILRRTLTQEGRSRCYINGQPATLQQMRDVGACLINIHGQHEHQSLLRRESQRDLLDQFASHLPLVETVAAHYHTWHQLKTEYDTLTTQMMDRANRSEFLNYQVEELDALGLREGEYEQISKTHQQLANHDQLLANCQQALFLSEDADTNAITRQLSQMIHLLEPFKTYSAALQETMTCLNEGFIQIQEATHTLRNYVDSLEQDPEELHALENRIAAIHTLSRKHKCDPQALPALLTELREELQTLEKGDVHLAELQSQIESSFKAYQTSAKKLTESRKKAGLKLSQQVTAHIQQLGMPAGELSVVFEPLEVEEPTAHGAERVTYLVRTNPGQPLQPLQKIVSGGELSRISLAIQVITAQQHMTYSLIFDEVDVGIGGGTAEIVGKLLKKLSQAAQVLCITHLAQVAAQGNHHIRVEKALSKNATKTQIHFLTKEEKIAEIARMMGGVQITEKTLEHAKEMLDAIG